MNLAMYQITHHPPTRPIPTIDDFNQVFLEKDRHSDVDAFREVVTGQELKVHAEFRLARTWQPPKSQANPVIAWVLATAMAVKNEGQRWGDYGVHIRYLISEVGRVGATQLC